MPFPVKSPEDLERFLLENQGIEPAQLVPLPHPYEDWEDEPIPPLTDEQLERYETGPDGVSALRVPIPKSEEERDKMVAGFLD